MSFLTVSAASAVIPALFSLPPSLAAYMPASAAPVLVSTAAVILTTVFSAAQTPSLEDNDSRLMTVAYEIVLYANL